MEEIWKTIEGFEDYQFSNHGRVKSLKFNKEKLLKPLFIKVGYYIVSLSNSKKQSKFIHQLVATAFLNHKTCGYKLVVNHKDFDKLNNNVDNLEIVTARENTNKKHIKSSSKYTGVSWHKKYNKWWAQINIKGKGYHLGFFLNEIEASEAYQNKLKEL